MSGNSLYLELFLQYEVYKFLLFINLETDPGQIVVSHIVCKVDENIFRDIMKDIISKDRKGECKAELG